MKKATLVVQKAYQANEIFNINNKHLNRDNCLACFRYLKEEFRLHGVDLSTQDINHIDSSEIIIYNDMPRKLPSQKNKQKSFLLIFESEVIRKDNWNLDRHEQFEKIFTWNDLYIARAKYIKINFSHELKDFSLYQDKKRLGMCTMISGNKFYKHSKELYSARKNVISWYEENTSNSFEFYGMGWNEYYFKGPLKQLNRFKLLKDLFKPNTSSLYRGVVTNKLDTLSNYKFCICYENAKDITGYITEKIFDCFFAGTIPIYWGAPNIKDHVPYNCFIDRREFDNFSELVSFIEKMTENEINTYRLNIKKYLASEKVYQFTCTYFSRAIVSEVINE